MKLINQNYQLLGTPQSLDEAWSFVAKAARNCYQSEKTKLDESEEEFCSRILLKHPEDLECDHMSPFEFGVVYLQFGSEPRGPFGIVDDIKLATKYQSNPYSRVNISKYKDKAYVTTNLRVILEHGWEDDLKYAGPSTKYHMKACCFKIDTCLHVYKDTTRHRTLSFAIESTRFCNYIKQKFGASVQFVRFPWTKPEEEEEVIKDLETIEQIYFKWINRGWQAQQAAEFLPQAVKGTVFMCGYEDNLQHMFRLRAEECSGPVHPLVAEVMKPMYESYKQWMNDNTSTIRNV